MQFLQDIISQIGAFFTDSVGEGFSGFIQTIVDFINGIIGKEANF